MNFQAIKWEVEDLEENMNIYIYGLNKENKKICVKIEDFKPYIYIELDKKIKWSKNKIELIYLYLRNILGDNYPSQSEIKLVEKKKNYYYEPAKFLCIYFNNLKSIKTLEYSIKKQLNIQGIGKILLKMHEQKADPVLKLFAMRKIKPSGWISIKNYIDDIEEYQEFSNSDINIISSYKDIYPATDINDVINPKIISYDIECISGDQTGNTFPNSKIKTDQIICISATIGNFQDELSNLQTYCLVNEIDKKECPNNINDSSIILHYKNECDLLLGWKDFINKHNPDILIGYNSLSFDDKYIYKRCKINNIKEKFLKIGRLKYKNSNKEKRKWSSSAYGDQEYYFININGILHIDMYPVIFKDFTNLMSYTLDYVSEYFLGEHKLDLPAKEMIQLWHRGYKEDIKNIVKYCNQDTLLPFKLFKKLNSWLSLSEMANVVMVPIIDLITRGQQFRVFSQIYCLCYELNVVCTDKWTDYKPEDSEKEFVGATVQNPKTGYWELVATYDFKSLYPTTIIAYNLCFSTFVPDYENPPQEHYHNIHLSEHINCEHDTSIRKTKTNKKFCREYNYRFYKADIKKGIVPTILENLLDARANTRKEISKLSNKLKNPGLSQHEQKNIKLLIEVLDKRQNGYKISANSMYGGFGSDFSYTPFYPAAASTTGMGRKAIQDAIDFAMKFRDDTVLVYGDTDSCMLHFHKIKNLKDCFQVCHDMEKAINNIFPKPMYLELEKIYSKYFILSKKRYIGYIVDPNAKLLSIDKKGVVIKRRDNCAFLRDIYSKLIDMVMDKQPKWKMFEFLSDQINKLLNGNIDLDKLIITKSIKENYKSTNLPHVNVANKMKSRGKYVAVGTRIRYIFIKTNNNKDPQYIKAEDPDFYLENKNSIHIDYLYYLEKQLINPIDEIFQVKFGVENILNNLFKLLKKDIIQNPDQYFKPKFKII